LLGACLLVTECVFADRGGPDGFGYEWIDSDEPDGPVYEWVNIANQGVSPGSDDDANYGPFALGFPFSFYGIDYDSVRICSNGFLSFTSSNTGFVNQGIPTPAEPNTMIAVAWDDLLLWPDGLRYYADAANQRFIVSWDYTWPEPWYLFEVILTSDGSIVFQYSYVSGGSSSCTIGIENQSGTDGLEVAFNEPYLHEHLAIRFEDGNRVTDLTVRPLGGSVVLRWTPGSATSYYVYGSSDGIQFGDTLALTSAPPCTLATDTGICGFYIVRAGH
jgi:hypothetical protein